SRGEIGSEADCLLSGPRVEYGAHSRRHTNALASEVSSRSFRGSWSATTTASRPSTMISFPRRASACSRDRSGAHDGRLALSPMTVSVRVTSTALVVAVSLATFHATASCQSIHPVTHGRFDVDVQTSKWLPLGKNTFKIVSATATYTNEFGKQN